MRLGLNLRVALASLLLCTIVGGVFALLVISVRDLRASSQRARHSEVVIAATNKLEKTVLDLESGHRGYVITHRQTFLEPWNAARVALPSQVRNLERLVADNPEQERRAHALGGGILSYLHDFSERVVAAARTQRESGAEIIATGEGKRRIDALRADFAGFVSAESALSASRRDEVDRDADRAIVFGVAGFGGLVLLIVLFVAYFSRLVVSPVRGIASVAERLARGDFTSRVDESGAAEVGLLERSFNAMASSLGESRDELESQNAELELQAAELEDQQAQLSAANDEFEAQHGELERALGELGREKERLDLLFAFGEMLARETEGDHLAENVMRELADLAEAEVGVAYVAAPGREDELVLVATRGIEASRLPERVMPGHGLAGRAVVERRAVLAARGDSELSVESFGREVHVRHEVHLALYAGKRALGVISLGRLGDRPFTTDQLEVLEHLASQTAVAVSNKLAFREALRLGDINRAVLDTTLDGITLTSSEGIIVLQNRAQQRLMDDLFQIPRDATVAEAVALLAERTTDPELFNRRMAEVVADQEFTGSHDVELLSGRTYTRYTAPVRSSAGNYVGRLWLIRETTGEREAERLKTELVATVSHELRTPLASIMGFAELLADRDYDEATRARFLRTIHSEASRLTGLVNDFLDLQRIEAGRFTLDLEVFELGELMGGEVELYSAQSSEHKLTIDLPDDPIRVLGERNRIAQVLGNLLSNAIKYSPRGGTVTVTASRNGSHVRVSVSDDGLGIPREQQARVFSKFFRVDSSDTREIDGTGLGLALCKEIIEAHAGNIGFSSVEGEGSTFWFELPSATSSNGHAAGRPVVLVVEDDPHAASLLTQYLTKADYAVEVTGSGEEALAAVVERPPDAICLDITLAGELDGWDVLSRLKEDRATARIPVVICTAGNGRSNAAALGAADFLTKPFGARELRAVIERVLPERRGSILVVDDDESVRALVLETLAGTGYELSQAADGAEALDRIAGHKPDAIVLDLMMPNVDGFEVLERLQRQPETRQIPVVVLTARRLTSHERSILQQRAVNLLEKSDYSGQELRALVERAIG